MDAVKDAAPACRKAGSSAEGCARSDLPPVPCFSGELTIFSYRKTVLHASA